MAFPSKAFKDPEKARAAGKANKGKPKSPSHRAKLILAKQKNKPDWVDSKLTPEQAHFITLLSENKFATAVKDMLLFIATKAETADDYHKLLTQLMKIPFLQKALDDLEREKQRDIIPIVVEVLQDNDQEELIKELLDKLEREGWHTAPSDSKVADLQ